MKTALTWKLRFMWNMQRKTAFKEITFAYERQCLGWFARNIFNTSAGHQGLLKMSAKVPFSKIARRIAYFILFLTFVTFLYYQTRVIMESSALGFGRSYEGKELLGALYVTRFLNRLYPNCIETLTLSLILSFYCEIFKVKERSYS